MKKEKKVKMIMEKIGNIFVGILFLVNTVGECFFVGRMDCLVKTFPGIVPKWIVCAVLVGIQLFFIGLYVLWSRKLKEYIQVLGFVIVLFQFAVSTLLFTWVYGLLIGYVEFPFFGLQFMLSESVDKLTMIIENWRFENHARLLACGMTFIDNKQVIENVIALYGVRYIAKSRLLKDILERMLVEQEIACHNNRIMVQEASAKAGASYINRFGKPVGYIILNGVVIVLVGRFIDYVITLV